MKIIDTIDCFIPGDWGNETLSEEAPCKVSCIRGADIIPIENNDFSHIPTRYISQQSFDTKCLQAGDIIVEKSGGSPTQSTGRVSFVSQELIDAVGSVVCSNFCVAFRVKRCWNPLYIYYYLQHAYKNGVFFNFEGKTSGIKNLQLEAAYNAVPIEDVNKTTQDSIVIVLDSIQKKMTINRQINQNLEALAKQLYDYWFVQFDFPNEEGKPYKSSGGKMVWNEDLQVNIPQNWNDCRLNEFIGKNNTGDWGTDEPSTNSIEVGCIRGADIIKLNDFPKRYIKSNNTSKLLSNWDIVIEVSGGSPTQATGRSAYITPGVIERNGGSITCSNFCHAFSFKDFEYSAYFFFVWRMFYDNNIMFNFEGKTSGIKNFMTEAFLANKWIKPSKPIVTKFFETVKNIYAKIDSNIAENNNLTKQRDELLPLLMNGQITIE